MHMKSAAIVFSLFLMTGALACGGDTDGDGAGGSGGSGGSGTGGDGGGSAGSGGDGGGSAGTGGDGGGSAGTGGDGGGSAGTGGDGGGSAGTGGDGGGMGGDGGGSAGTGGDGGGMGGDGGGSAGTGGAGGGMGGDGGGSAGTGGDGGGSAGTGGDGGGGPSDPDCLAACTAYVDCEWTTDLSGCVAECEDMNLDDLLECVYASAVVCDGDGVDACFNDAAEAWCGAVCGDVGSCSENPADAEFFCFDTCYWNDWFYDSSFRPCFETAAPTCDSAALNACFTWEEPACVAACNHGFFECGVSWDDAFGEMNRAWCTLSCEMLAWSEDDIQCVIDAPCSTAALNACMFF